MCAGVDPQHPPTTLTPKSLYEGGELGSQLLGLFGIDRLALRTHQWQARIRDHADEAPRRLAEVANRVAHLRRAGRTVQADDVDGQCVERRANRANIRSQQHTPVGNERRLRLDRNAAQAALELPGYTGDCRFQLEQILHRLEHQQVGAAFDERAGLFGVDVAQLPVGDLRERRIG